MSTGGWGTIGSTVQSCIEYMQKTDVIFKWLPHYIDGGR